MLDSYECLQCNSSFPSVFKRSWGWLLGDDGRLSTLTACSECSEVLSILQDWSLMQRDACQLCTCVLRTSLRFLLHHCQLESLGTWSSADSLQILNF